MTKPFASTADVTEKASTFEELAEGVYAFTAEGDPNLGAVVGEHGVLAVDARATPAAAREWLDALRAVTDAPIRYLVLTHYHAVRVLGASAFDAERIVAHERTREYLRTLWETTAAVERRGGGLRDAFGECRSALEPRFGDWAIFEHCLPFNVARAWDEARGSAPQVWTAEKDAAVWAELQS